LKAFYCFIVIRKPYVNGCWCHIVLLLSTEAHCSRSLLVNHKANEQILSLLLYALIVYCN